MAWGAIGARTTESQLHRQLASGLSCPVGFKNGTAGNVKIAVDAIGAARSPHHFLGVTKDGHAGIFRTTGNLDCHVILRGGDRPNYGAEDVAKTSALLEAAKLPARIMIDFSHANSSKQHERQVLVGEDVAGQIAGGDPPHRRGHDREQPRGRPAGREARRAPACTGRASPTPASAGRTPSRSSSASPPPSAPAAAPRAPPPPTDPHIPG